MKVHVLGTDSADHRLSPRIMLQKGKQRYTNALALPCPPTSEDRMVLLTSKRLQ